MEENENKEQSFGNCSVILTVLFIVLYFVFTIMEISPSFAPMRGSLKYILLSKTVLSGVVLYFAWASKIKPPVSERIIISAFALMTWVPLIIKSDRIVLLLQITVFLVLLTHYIVHSMTPQKHSVVTIAVIFVSGISIMWAVVRNRYLNDPLGIHFWQASLAAAVVITLVFIILLIMNKIHLKDQRIPAKILSSIQVLYTSFILIACIINALNYALDFSKPSDATISKKNIETGYNDSTTYFFTVKINDRYRNYEVYKSEYNEKQVGDIYANEIYSGAFGDEYYFYDYDK